MITISVTYWVLILLAGVVALVIAATNEGLKSSATWFRIAFWIGFLALVSPFR